MRFGRCASVMVALSACTRVEAPSPLPPPAEVIAPVAKPVARRPAPRPSPWGNTATAIATRPAALPDAGPDTQIVGGLDRAALGAAVEAALPSIGDCFSGNEGASVGLSFHADPSGKPSNVKVSGASAEVERCVTARIAAVKLPAFNGNPVAVQMPLTVRREPGQPAPTAAVPAAVPAAPSLFVKP